MCQTVVRNSLIIPTIYTKKYRGQYSPFLFLPFVFCSELNKYKLGKIFSSFTYDEIRVIGKEWDDFKKFIIDFLYHLREGINKE